MNPDGLEMHTIYKGHPFYRRGYVVCRIEVTGHKPEPVNHGPVGRADTLEEARELVPPWNSQMIPRAESDDVTIVETWI